jgi:hypothetical protein
LISAILSLIGIKTCKRLWGQTLRFTSRFFCHAQNGSFQTACLAGVSTGGCFCISQSPLCCTSACVCSWKNALPHMMHILCCYPQKPVGLVGNADFSTPIMLTHLLRPSRAFGSQAFDGHQVWTQPCHEAQLIGVGGGMLFPKVVSSSLKIASFQCIGVIGFHWWHLVQENQKPTTRTHDPGGGFGKKRLCVSTDDINVPKISNRFLINQELFTALFLLIISEYHQ